MIRKAPLQMRCKDCGSSLSVWLQNIFQAVGESVRRGFVETPSSWFWERVEPSGFFGERCMHSTLFGLRACACTADWHAYCCIMHAWHAFNVASLNNVAVIINSMLIVMETMRRVFIVPPQRKRARMREIRVKKKKNVSGFDFPTTERD